MKKSSEHNNLQQAKPTQVGRLAQKLVYVCLSLHLLWLLLSFVLNVVLSSLCFLPYYPVKKSCLLGIRDKTKWWTRKKKRGRVDRDLGIFSRLTLCSPEHFPFTMITSYSYLNSNEAFLQCHSRALCSCCCYCRHVLLPLQTHCIYSEDNEPSEYRSLAKLLPPLSLLKISEQILYCITLIFTF